MSSAIVATNAPARAVAEAALARGATAIEAVVSGWFALAGSIGWAALAPLTIAMAGGGAGVRFVDGRARQPGKGVARPVRYAREDDAPDVARVAVPGSVAAIAVVSALAPGLRMGVAAAEGIKLAKDAGAKRRAALLDRIAKAPPMALTDRGFVGEVGDRAPTIDGALLGPEDLANVHPDVSPGAEATVAGRNARVAPWVVGASFASLREPTSARSLLLACDRQGAFAAAIVEPPPATLGLYDGEVELPLVAEPFVKGVPRTKPGLPLLAPAPLAVVLERDTPFALVASLARQLDEEAAAALLGVAWESVDEAAATSFAVLRLSGASPIARAR